MSVADPPGWLHEWPLAHRGLHGPGVPENSVSAFARAVEAGVGIELDVHLTLDGHAVVVHDPDLERVTGQPGAVAQLTLEAVAARRLHGSADTVPTLAAALDLVAGRVPVMVELKQYGRRVGALEAAVADRLRDYPGPVCVAAFHPASLAWFAEHAPAVVRVQTASTFTGVAVPAWLRPMLRNLAFVRWSRPQAISYELAGLPNRAADALRGRGLALIAWTVRTDGDLARAREVADNVIFEDLPVAAVRPV